MAEQKTKLMAMLGTAVTNLHKLDTILPAVQALGARHKGYGVTAEQYEHRSVPHCCGPWRRASAPTSRRRTKAAWTEAYTALAGVMTNAVTAGTSRWLGPMLAAGPRACHRLVGRGSWCVVPLPRW